MSALKNVLKMFPLAYACNEQIKKYQVAILKNKLKLMKEKETTMPSYIEAYRILSALRAEALYDNQVLEPIKINENLDLSIIIPIYNSEKYLKQCLESVRTQVTAYSYQIICVDDGSTDCSTSILDEYANNDRFIIIHQKNKGHSGARNTALKCILGKYLMFIDSDDFITQDYIDVMLHKILKENADIVQGPVIKCNSLSVPLTIIERDSKKLNSYSELEKFGGAPWGKIYKTSLWNKIYFPESMMFEDTIIFNVIFRRSVNIYGVDGIYYMYRVYGQNTIDKLQGDSRLIDAVWSVRYAVGLSRKLDLKKNDDYYKFLLIQCSKHIYYRIKGFSRKIQEACFIIMCKVIKEYNEGISHFTTSSNYIFYELENSFMKKNFEKWKLCSDILKKSGW